MKAIVLHRPLSAGEIRELLSLPEGGLSLFAHPGYTLPEELTHLPFRYFEVSDEVKRAINTDASEWVLTFGDKVAGDSFVAALLQRETRNIWHYQKFRIYYELRQIYFLIREVESIASDHEAVLLFTHNGTFSQVNCLASNVEVRYLAGKKPGLNFSTLYKFGFVTFIRFIRGIFQLRKAKRFRHLIVNRPVNEQPMQSLEGKGLVRENYYLGYLLRKFPDRFLVIEEADHPKFRVAGSYPIQRRLLRPRKDLNQLNGDFVWLSGLIKTSVRKKIKTASKWLISSYPAIENVAESPQEKLIARVLRSLHKTSVFYLAKSYAFEAFFTGKGFRSLSTVDENSPTIRVMLDAARKAGLKTFGLQHGVIHPLHMAYRFTEKDIVLNPFPDLTFSWGESWAECLFDFGHYPRQRVLLTGQPRTDIIPVLSGMKRSEVIGHLDDSRPVLVFATQPLKDEVLRRRISADLFSAAVRFPNLQLLVKPHPRETDMDYYRNIAADAGIHDLQFVRDTDLYLLISICDLLVTASSTVGSETIYFHKPLAILDHLKLDEMGYDAAGVAFRATNADEMADIIRGVLDGKLKPDPGKYKAYIRQYAYKIDGQVADRIMQEIEKT
jgi:hypothetical protein